MRRERRAKGSSTTVTMRPETWAVLWAQGQVDRRVSGLTVETLNRPECTLSYIHSLHARISYLYYAVLAATFSHDAHLMKTRIWHPINIIIHPHMWLS